MIRKTAFFLLAIFSLSIFSSAQYVPSNDENSLKMNAQTKSDKKKKKKIPNRVPPNAVDLYFFLPRTTDAWTLSVTSTGGFSGTTRLLGAVNSNGNYLCSAEEDFRNRLLEKPFLDEIFNFVETQDFSKFSRVVSTGFDFCSDCTVTTLNFQTRNGFANHVIPNGENTSEEIKRIYDHLSDLDECR